MQSISSVASVVRPWVRRSSIATGPICCRYFHCGVAFVSSDRIIDPVTTNNRYPSSTTYPFSSTTLKISTRQHREFVTTTNPASTTTSNASKSSNGYAFVDHGDAYLVALAGPHGKQLELAKVEGLGKDNPPFDPFIEEELEEARLLAEATEEEGKGQESTSNIKNEEEDGDEDDEDDDEVVDDNMIDDWRKKYNNDGSVRRTKSEKATLAAGAPSGGLFAIIELAGSQHKVTTDDVLIVNRLQPVTTYSVGSIHTLTGSDVLLIGSSHYTLVGMPYVSTAEVDVMVEEITQDAKIVIFKKRRRKNSKRKTGFRRDVTMLRILDIRPPPAHANKYYHPRPEPAPLVITNKQEQQQVVTLI